MVEYLENFGISKYAKIAFIAEIGVFLYFLLSKENFYKNVHNSYIFNLNRLHGGSFWS